MEIVFKDFYYKGVHYDEFSYDLNIDSVDDVQALEDELQLYQLDDILDHYLLNDKEAQS